MRLKTLVSIGLWLLISIHLAMAQNENPINVIPGIQVKFNNGNFTEAIRLILILTVLSLAPSIIIMTTSFIRIVTVLSVLRQAIGLPNVPPNQVITSLALFLTFYVMYPVINQINQNALQPYLQHKITDKQFIQNTIEPLKEFMVRNTKVSTERTFLLASNIPNKDNIKNINDLPLSVVIPAFMVSELSIAFQIIFLLYLPFLIIDMVVSAILLAMGIIMIPPTVISLPFKIMLFVLVNGWELVILSLVRSYH
ncbi:MULTISPECIES: flagellar type III secretion system pore protein FliP [unclassified Hydrogenobaculum]|jgi:flagellar biosynthetic protein FliP|nr:MULTISPECIES: flagellar type III secretion system pore protein FliP [unclassified Hydrogenobaculum]AEF19042.1 flagellar biosynthetic protein FliP [Hydrogenobaculum sp. 3684]AEG46330.1 flagellar biosynthetic protein FliP [Hydrogenobaculum sp. SHO]AGG14975.1 flagellar biosynthetic protein FliP [Hydrogenobaculum sp. HO]